MLLVALDTRLLIPIFTLLLVVKAIPQRYYSSGRSFGPNWSGSGNGFGNLWKSDNINVGIGGTGERIVSQQIADDGTVLETNGWNKGLNGNIGLMKQFGGNGGGLFGNSGLMGNTRGNGWLGGGLNGGVGASGGSTTIRRVGDDGSYVYGQQNNVGLLGNLGLGLNGGGMGSGSALGPCGNGICGNGGIRGFGNAGLNAGLNLNSGHLVENNVLANGGYVRKSSKSWGLGGNLGANIGLGGDGGWRVKSASGRSMGRSMGRSSGRSLGYVDESPYISEAYYEPQRYVYQEPVRVQRPRQHPYLQTLEGMYSREMGPRARIVMIDDPVVIIMPEDGADGGGDSSTESSSSTGAPGDSTTADSSTEGGSSTTGASTTEGESTTEGDTTTEGDETTTEGDEETTTEEDEEETTTEDDEEETTTEEDEEETTTEEAEE